MGLLDISKKFKSDIFINLIKFREEVINGKKEIDKIFNIFGILLMFVDMIDYFLFLLWNTVEILFY